MSARTKHPINKSRGFLTSTIYQFHFLTLARSFVRSFTRSAALPSNTLFPYRRHYFTILLSSLPLRYNMSKVPGIIQCSHTYKELVYSIPTSSSFSSFNLPTFSLPLPFVYPIHLGVSYFLLFAYIFLYMYYILYILQRTNSRTN